MDKILNDGEFGNKVVIVTGAASGIGRASAIRFANLGATVIIADTDETGGNETARQITDNRQNALFVKTDVSLETEVVNLIKITIETFARLDIAHNNAGIEGISNLLDCTVEQWDSVLNTNLKGVWLCMKHQIPEMLKQGKGSIVNTSSVSGLLGLGWSNYAASKHGVIGLTKSASIEFIKKNIRINAICPAMTLTGMTEPAILENPEIESILGERQPIGRMATAEEIANTAVWLCSDQASYITGQAIAVDGGLTAV
jgi:NAD(P)-dependent dehydrogenase (short-subunit alcohol dehydrogenase family)